MNTISWGLAWQLVLNSQHKRFHNCPFRSQEKTSDFAWFASIVVCYSEGPLSLTLNLALITLTLTFRIAGLRNSGPVPYVSECLDFLSMLWQCLLGKGKSIQRVKKLLQSEGLVLRIPVLAPKSWHNGINTHSIRSPVVDEERMSPGHWLGSMLCISFSALTLIVGWQATSGP